MRKLMVSAVLCWLLFLTTGSAFSNEVVGVLLDFPPGSLDEVEKIEVFINQSPTEYTNMACTSHSLNDPCPGYKNITNYLGSLDPTYTGPDFPGALGVDWQRDLWTQASKKITYYKGEGVDTVQSGVLDGYIYYPTQVPPTATHVILTGYPGKTKFSYFDTGENVTQLFFTFDVWAILLEDDWNLGDAILVFQTMAGMSPEIPEDGPYDINADGKIGLEEAGYILQRMAGIRTKL